MLRSLFTKVFLVACCGLFSAQLRAQNRLSDPNALAWFNGFGTFYFSPKTALYTEYQWRREGPVDSWQQSLARVGIQRKLGARTTGILGYGHITTFPYGEYPAGPHPIIEHRIWQQLSWDETWYRVMGDGEGARPRFTLNHRLRSEQRFIQKIPQREPVRRVDGHAYLNRLRYQLRATLPLSYYVIQPPNVGNTKQFSTRAYLAAYDEIFIGFGRNVGQNIFDQNRVGLLLGYNVNPKATVRLEGGYFNQTVQQGAEVGGKEVFQYNHGFILNAYYTLQAKAAR